MTKIVLLMAVLCSVAKADFIKKTEMNLICEQGFQLITDGERGSTYLNQELVHQDTRVFAGTEGGAPYQQFVGGGYNITLQGKEFSEAFSQDNDVYREVTVEAAVSDYNNDKSFTVKCSGKIKFFNAF